jgi:hypothetical protein
MTTIESDDRGLLLDVVVYPYGFQGEVIALRWTSSTTLIAFPADLLDAIQQAIGRDRAARDLEAKLAGLRARSLDRLATASRVAGHQLVSGGSLCTPGVRC